MCCKRYIHVFFYHKLSKCTKYGRELGFTRPWLTVPGLSCQEIKLSHITLITDGVSFDSCEDKGLELRVSSNLSLFAGPVQGRLRARSGRVKAWELRVKGSGFRVSWLRCRVSGIGLRVSSSGLGFLV